MSPPPLPHTPSINSLRSQGETSPSLPAGFRNIGYRWMTLNDIGCIRHVLEYFSDDNLS